MILVTSVGERLLIRASEAGVLGRFLSSTLEQEEQWCIYGGGFKVRIEPTCCALETLLEKLNLIVSV